MGIPEVDLSAPRSPQVCPPGAAVEGRWVTSPTSGGAGTRGWHPRSPPPVSLPVSPRRTHPGHPPAGAPLEPRELWDHTETVPKLFFWVNLELCSRDKNVPPKLHSLPSTSVWRCSCTRASPCLSKISNAPQAKCPLNDGSCSRAAAQAANTHAPAQRALRGPPRRPWAPLHSRPPYLLRAISVRLRSPQVLSEEPCPHSQGTQGPCKEGRVAWAAPGLGLLSASGGARGKALSIRGSWAAGQGADFWGEGQTQGPEGLDWSEVSWGGRWKRAEGPEGLGRRDLDWGSWGAMWGSCGDPRRGHRCRGGVPGLPHPPGFSPRDTGCGGARGGAGPLGKVLAWEAAEKSLPQVDG